MTTVVEISDNEDADDCVIKSVIFVADDEPVSELYYQVCKENKLLADFIEMCLRLENSEGMHKILKKGLLKVYYEADKTGRESQKFQKNLRRANHLLQVDPRHKFTHIKDLCNILRALRVKKRVPFVTITTNLTGNNHKPNGLKRSNTEQLNVINGESKKAKYDCNKISSVSKNIDVSFNDTCDTYDDSMSMENCSQQSNVADEESLLIPKEDIPVDLKSKEQKIKRIEKRIAFYKSTIAVLDEQEVEDDSENSPYIKSERLKAKIVSLHKERCQLMGNQPVKHKVIRLKLADGHPPGPTRVLERFLNINLNKDGDPPFPDFCDVVTCVTEANDKDNLGWTKAQILNEASALFTSCGRALQKRRQNREYRDLVYKAKLENLERDPADDDPELQAKLEENKRIAVKKELDILERFTMMQYLPSTSRKNPTSFENVENENIADNDNVKAGTQRELITSNYNIMENCVSNPSTAKSEKSFESAAPNSSHKNIINISNSHSYVERHQCHQSFNDCRLQVNGDKEKSFPASTSLDDVDIKIDAVGHCSDVKNGFNKTTYKINSNDAGHVIKPLDKVKHKGNNNGVSKSDNNFENNKLNLIDKPIKVVPPKSQVKQKVDEDAIGIFKRWGDNFTLTIEIINDN